MAHTCPLELQDPAGSHRSLTLTFEDGEWEILMRARKFCGELRQPEIMEREVWNLHLTVHCEAGQGVSATGTFPANDEVAAVLHRLRPLILEDEPTYFHRVVNVIARRGQDPGFRARIGSLKDLFAGKEFQSVVAVSMNDELVNSEKMLKTYLNAREFHRDEEKEAAIADLEKVLPPLATRGIFLNLVLEKLKALRGLELLLDTLAGLGNGVRL